MRPASEFRQVEQLITAGLNDCEISRETGVPRRTVRDWRTQPAKWDRERRAGTCDGAHDFSVLPAEVYCYLLGMYLGDGCISRSRRTWMLRITCDTQYPGIIERCREAIDILMPGQRAGVWTRPSGTCADVYLCSNHWPCLFPQHGPGLKHRRPIKLEPWQQNLVEQAPEDFIRGLIHSDGCRVIANDRGVKSIRYHFTNHSEDILGLFTGTLDRLGIPWTRSTQYVVSIYRKAATARLDEFIGPKC
ncbi:LAGLIDADG family homing endonuclease [Mycolicibacterium pallens]|uniref:LAGLIDADG family homing endonuclease n=1 Tax=Mycolicibacterium pallens TaxID=370524 RepID=A0ABX8VD34_9MYCO|nr:LAGLIDADG family homing endonuclease [Mycolicibacterium pallens]APE13903.1 hypothetical protein BOH72_00315 [Mycobacterium sp. WY10]QYL15692.1 LAGLIDADG family homing endonuclease [Mycolicibacterium pallens]